MFGVRPFFPYLMRKWMSFTFFFFNDTATTEIYTLSLHDALPISYVGCVDDAADLIQLGIEKQENIRKGVDLMLSRSKEFLETLNKLSAEAVEIDIYKDNLDDAIEGTRDAMNDAEKAKRAVAPPPVRRKN